MWNPEHRLAADRRGLRYPSDLTDAEWALLAPLVPPAPRWTQALGRCARGSRRDFLRARDGLPMESFAEGPAAREHRACLLHAVGLGRDPRSHSRGASCRGPRGGGARSEPFCRDRRSQSAKAAQPFDFAQGGGLRSLGKASMRARRSPAASGHILVDTLGLLLGVSILPAHIQDRDGACHLLRRVWRRFPFIERIFADAGYQGPKMAKAVSGTGRWKIEIVKRSDLHHFVVLPKRWTWSEALPGSAAIDV